MSGELDLELLASIASGGLGCWVEDAAGRSVYAKSDDCIGCLRDLQRFFRYDDQETRPAFFAVSKYNFARSDLVPLIVTYPEDYEVVYNALKVATFLTMPSSEPLVTTNRALQEEHMQAVREAFLAQDALAAVVGMLAEPLARHPRMDEKDAALVQLVIAFLKNLVAIPAAPVRAAAGGTTGTSAEAARRVKAGLLERLFQDNVMDLLLLLAQHAQQRPFKSEAPVLVEIFMHLFAGVEPQQLLDAPRLLAEQQAAQRREQQKRAAAAAAQKAAKAKAAAAHIVRPGQSQPGAGGPSSRGAAAARAAVANTSHLARLPALPPAMGRQVLHRSMVPRHVAQAAPSRHAHSGAVYVRRHSDHSANIVVRHNPHRSELPQLPAVVDAKKAAAQKRDGPAGGGSGTAAAARPPLGAELLVKLDAYMQQFLDGAYDLLMGQVFRELQPGLNISRCSEADFLHFVRLATYCTRYVRLREERKLQSKLKGGPSQEKAGRPAPPAAAAAAGASPAGSGAAGADASGALQQQQNDGQQQPEQQQQEQQSQQRQEDDEEVSPFAAISATMGWDSFHWLTMLWILLSNMEGGGKQKDHSDKNWDLQHASVPLLKEMLLTLDLARVAGSPADRRAADRLQRRLLHDDLKESGLLPVLGRLIRGYSFRFQPRSHGVDLVETLHVVLGMLDRLSNAEPGGFKVKAAVRQSGGRRKQAATAPADGGEEGEGAGDGAAARLASGGEDSPAGSGSAGQAAGEGEEEEAAAEQRVGRTGDPFDDDDEGRRVRATREVSFEAARRVRQECAHPAMVHFYAWLLQGYRTNAAFTNHAIVSFFRRISEPRQLNLEPMLYQLSVLRLFEAILSDVAIKRAPDFQDLLSFCKQTVRNMFARMMPDLSELRQRAGQLEANLEARFNAAQGDEEDGEADSAEQAARRQTRLAQAELKARENAAKAMFVELLFWKGANVAEDVRNEYNWRGLVDPQEHKRRGGRRGRGSALGDDDGSDGEGQLGFASYRRKQLFGEEDVVALRSEFERCNGHKDCLARLTFEFGGKWKKSQIGRQLKAMGLQRGRLTDRQVDVLRDKYEEVRGKLDCFQLLEEELNAGFTANQIKRQLTKLGIVSGRAKEQGLTAEQEGLLRELFAEHGGSGRADRFELMAEGMEDSLGRLLKPAQVKRYLRSIGLLAAPRRSKKDAAFDALLGGSDDEAGGGGQPSQSLGGQGGGGGGGETDGSGSDGDSAASSDRGSEFDSDAESQGGFESAQEDLDGGGASDAETSGGEAVGGAGSRSRNRTQQRQQRLAKIERLQKNRQRDRADSPDLPATMPLGPEEASDSEGEEGEAEAEFQRRAAEAAAAASPASSGGSGFVSLAGSDAEEEVAAKTVTAGKAARKGKRSAAQRRPEQKRRQPASKKPRRSPAPAGSDSDAGSGDDSDAGFASAQESEPEGEGVPAGPAAPAQRTQRGKSGDGTAGGKRKAADEPAGPSSAQKRAALAALRAKRQGVAAAELPATEPLGAWQDSEPTATAATEVAAGDQGAEAMDAENEAPAQQRQEAPAAAAKPAAGGRRLIKKGSGGAAVAAAAAAPPSGFDDLEDF